MSIVSSTKAVRQSTSVHLCTRTCSTKRFAQSPKATARRESRRVSVESSKAAARRKVYSRRASATIGSHAPRQQQPQRPTREQGRRGAHSASEVCRSVRFRGRIADSRPPELSQGQNRALPQPLPGVASAAVNSLVPALMPRVRVQPGRTTTGWSASGGHWPGDSRAAWRQRIVRCSPLRHLCKHMLRNRAVLLAARSSPSELCATEPRRPAASPQPTRCVRRGVAHSTIHIAFSTALRRGNCCGARRASSTASRARGAVDESSGERKGQGARRSSVATLHRGRFKEKRARGGQRSARERCARPRTSRVHCIAPPAARTVPTRRAENATHRRCRHGLRSMLMVALAVSISAWVRSQFGEKLRKSGSK